MLEKHETYDTLLFFEGHKVLTLTFLYYHFENVSG